MAGFRDYWQNAQNSYNNYGRPRISLVDRIKDFFQSDRLLPKIISVNIAVWFIAIIINIFFFLFQISKPFGLTDISNHFIYYLSLPANVHELFHRPWSIFTYMFVHQDFSHIFFNMLILYFGGNIFENYFSSKKLLWTYIIGGLFGAFFFIGGYNFFPAFISQAEYAVAIGASASVMAVLIACATKMPNLEINLFLIGRIKFKWLAIGIFLIDFLSLTGVNAGGHLAHIGGALWGFLYGYLDKNTANRESWFEKLKKYYNRKKVEKKFQQETKKRQKEYQKAKDSEKRAKEAEQKRVNEILSKISRSGYSSLTQEEKDIIFSKSNR